MGIDVPSGVRLDNISSILKRTKDLTTNQINTFYKKATEIIQKEEFKRAQEFVQSLDKND